MGNIHTPLESVRIATPCSVSWEGMEGGERVRLCQTCHKNVYNLSSMSRGEAEALINEKEGNLCVTFFRRSDGTIMTDDCPVGLRLVRRPFKWLAAGTAMLLVSGISLATGHDPLAKQPTAPTPSTGIQQPTLLEKVLDMLLNRKMSNTFAPATGGAMTADISEPDEFKSA